MYTVFLNNKGRVLYDTLIYKWDRDDAFIIECDKNVLNSLQKHLKLYKLKRQINFADMSNELKVHAFISNVTEDAIESKNDIKIYKDPRLSDLGCRVISPAQTPEPDIAQVVGKDVEIKENEDGYKYLRYKLGVGEGADDLPPGTTFPLEVNCDYLHGVSFHKGCYIGQELTARVHHTGVVRKRIMPIKFTDTIKGELEKDSVISAPDNPKSNLGKLKGVVQDYGIGLLRIKEALDAKVLAVGKCTIEVVKPSWWPLEAPKDKQPLAKSE
ncbi:hypothetical protein O3G_MSEX012007 [Manduca sexta]|uniref:CAF17 C-terminal domain-containing protein n=1 Tax=Manduca sexta TaxID=7130 RepID=A0A921ZNJ0_MANSE|nr:hypothetical protein O3G_MSEX012007 [Manduca sexta]